MNKNIDISIIIPISERYDDVREVFSSYKDALAATGKNLEWVYVLDGAFPEAYSQLKELQQSGERIRLIQLGKWFGEAVALTAGFEHSSGETVLTLPAYYQINPTELPKLLKELDNHDMVIARRWPRNDPWFNRLQAKVFHWIFNKVSECKYHDLGCGVRAIKRAVINEVPLYGDQHRFFPVLANRKGFRILELKLEQAKQDQHRRVYMPGVYLRRILDILTVFFLVKFTKKPLRFFGLIGTGTFLLGMLSMLYLIVERLFAGVALADRPAILLSSLLIVLGIQIFALGLVGELIIFTHAKEIKEYTIDEIIEQGAESVTADADNVA